MSSKNTIIPIAEFKDELGRLWSKETLRQEALYIVLTLANSDWRDWKSKKDIYEELSPYRPLSVKSNAELPRPVARTQIVDVLAAISAGQRLGRKT